MADEDFEKKQSELVNSDSLGGFLGIKHSAQYYTKAGVSSLYSDVYFLNDVKEGDLLELPDYILSDTLNKDLDSTVVTCLLGLKNTKYMPSDATVGGRHGAVQDGEREGAYADGWEDFEISGQLGQPLYTPETIKAAVQQGEHPFGAVMWLIVRDICDSGEFLSQDWYRARIIYEYFREYPVPPENAYLIGELFKEFCAKQMFEGDLREYYQGLLKAKNRRKAGTVSTKEKAEELRVFCVGLFAKMANSLGARLMLAPPELQAEELRSVAIEERPEDFIRAGKYYSKEWFLRNVIEDRKLDIVEAVERIRGE